PRRAPRGVRLEREPGGAERGLRGEPVGRRPHPPRHERRQLRGDAVRGDHEHGRGLGRYGIGDPHGPSSRPWQAQSGRDRRGASGSNPVLWIIGRPRRTAATRRLPDGLYRGCMCPSGPPRHEGLLGPHRRPVMSSARYHRPALSQAAPQHGRAPDPARPPGPACRNGLSGTEPTVPIGGRSSTIPALGGMVLTYPGRPLGEGDPRRIGRYAVRSVLGAGGQGVVYSAEGPQGDKVAVKLLHAHIAREPDFQRRFLREAQIMREVATFCTARVLEVGVHDDRPYLASEYVAGISLQELLRTQGPCSESSLHRLAVSTLTALAAIHRAGIVHRDFKPANVILGPEGPVVIDFGIARVLEQTTTHSGIMGTPAY